MPKTHDREFFCKYVTSRTACRILSNFEVRWSSPLLFNDPFDTQFDFNFGFEPDEIREPFLEEIKAMVFSQEELKCEDTVPLCLMITLLRQVRHKLTPTDFADEMGPAIEKGVSGMIASLKKYSDEWHEFLRNIRVFCVSEPHDDLLMWAHYANSHTGAVLKLKCISELDTALCA